MKFTKENVSYKTGSTCPICGGSVEILVKDDSFSINCTNCGVEFSFPFLRHQIYILIGKEIKRQFEEHISKTQKSIQVDSQENSSKKLKASLDEEKV